jgi:NADPH:quinone reductase-like Zn-dependent oxidoreductase
MKAIHVEAPGPAYQLVLGNETAPKPGPGQVLIKVAAAGLNNADLLQARGKYPPPPGASTILGMEVSGTVIELGAGVSEWKSGDRVCALLAGGGYAEEQSPMPAVCCLFLTVLTWSKRRACRKPSSPPGPILWIQAGCSPARVF